MSKEKIEYIQALYKCVGRYRDLGTGRTKRKILVGDSDDARTSFFSFEGNVHHNWQNEIGLKSKDGAGTFYTATQTFHGRRAFIFFWNELTADLWFRQIERQRIMEWFDTSLISEPRDSVAMAELIVEVTKGDYRVSTYPGTEITNLKPIQIEVMKLSLRELRMLNNLVPRNRVMPEPLKSAA